MAIMSYGKKGVSPLVVSLIVLSVVSIILIILYGAIFGFVEKISDREFCRASVLAKYGGKTASLGTSETSVNLQCFTQKLAVKKDGIYRTGKKGTELIADFRTNKLVGGAIFDFKPGSGTSDKIERNNQKSELVKLVVANEMYDCWDQFGEGKLPVFTADKRCVICSEITFADDWLDVEGLENFPEEAAKKDYIMDFGHFLNTAKIKQGSDQTYANFLANTFPEGMFINTKTRTNIIFRAIAYSQWEKFKDAALFGCTLGILGSEKAITGAVAAGKAAATAESAAALTAAKAALSTFAKSTAITAVSACSVGLAVGTFRALYEGETWIPSVLIGPEGIISSECDRLY